MNQALHLYFESKLQNRILTEVLMPSIFHDKYLAFRNLCPGIWI